MTLSTHRGRPPAEGLDGAAAPVTLAGLLRPGRHHHRARTAYVWSTALFCAALAPVLLTRLFGDGGEGATARLLLGCLALFVAGLVSAVIGMLVLEVLLWLALRIWGREIALKAVGDRLAPALWPVAAGCLTAAAALTLSGGELFTSPWLGVVMAVALLTHGAVLARTLADVVPGLGRRVLVLLTYAAVPATYAGIGALGG